MPQGQPADKIGDIVIQTQAKCYIGIDVSKETLAFSSEDTHFSCKNKKAAVLKALRRLQQKAQGRQLWLACEATGVYHRTLAICADTMGLPLSVLTPSRVHAFARACGQLAKTDPLDAAIIRRFAKTYQPEATPYDESLYELKELVSTRRLLVKARKALKQRLKTLENEDALQALHIMHDQLDAQIAKLEAKLARLMQAQVETDPRIPALEAVYCVGPVLLATLMAYLNELGTLGRKRAASLAGVAPHPRDSGDFRGKRFIRGGRAIVRQALYASATAFLLPKSPLRPLYDRLRACGLSHRSALCAVVRHFIVHLDTVARNALKKHS